MCYVIDADTSYNLLLGRSWIHANWIVPSILHQCFKNVGDDAVVRTVFAKMQLFKGVENYSTDFLLYQENDELVKETLPDGITVVTRQTQNQKKLCWLPLAWN